MGDWNSSVPSHSAGATSKASKLQTLDDIATALTAAWTTWTPTLTNLTLGDGTVVAKYRRLGKTVDYRFKFKLGGTSAVGTTPMVTLPVTPSTEFEGLTDHDRIGMGWLFDVSTAASRQVDPLLVAAATIQINHMNATPASTSTTATVPWTWATGDILTLYGAYYTD